MKRFLAGFLAAVQVALGAFSAESRASGKGFPDVKPGAWYYEDVTEMTGQGLLAGYKDGTFRPERKVTGAEFVSITARRAGLSPSQGQSSHWAAGTMQAALEKNWYDWDEFPPTAQNYDKPISRQVAVKVLMKAFLPDVRGDYMTESAKIKDFSQLDGRYYEAVLGAYAAGAVFGDKEGTFRPRDGLSRAEACALIRRAARISGAEEPGPAGDESKPPVPEEVRQGGISENGWLQVKETQLCNERGEPVVLHGMSSHGLQWYGDFTSAGAVETTAEYGANLFRVAMYTGENGYLSQPAAMEKKAVAAVDAAIQKDMYVILDWHILSDGNPRSHLKEAKSFFAAMAKRYKDSPAVLFEICNEPNGGVSWANDVKPYARELVKTIRGEGAENVILIGSPTWSQDIHLAAADPVEGENLMYTLHFYAGTHGKELRDRMDAALEKGLPLFVSEWGTSRADGSGGVFLKESEEWLDFLDSRKISWANWSLCDKNETSAALKPGASQNGGWKEKDLSESGKFVFSRF